MPPKGPNLSGKRAFYWIVKWLVTPNNFSLRLFKFSLMWYSLRRIMNGLLNPLAHSLLLVHLPFSSLRAKRPATVTLFSTILGQHVRQPTVRTLCRPILLEAKRKCCGLASWLAMDDYPSVISALSKMAVVVCTTVIPFVLYLLGQTN